LAAPKLTHRQRLETCLAGAKPDRPPVALWRHFPVDDQVPEDLAAATLDFQRTYDFDFVKVTPASSFAIKDWGAGDEWRGAVEGTRQYTRFVIQEPEDWERLPVLDPGQGALAAQLRCLRLIVSELGAETPAIQTVFSPLAQAKNLAGGAQLLVHLRRHPQAVLAGLGRIAESTRRFVEAIRATGAAGVFYAVQHAQFGLLSLDEFLTFGRPFDLQVLEAARDFWLNVLHIHGQDVMFEPLAAYPVQVINWHDRETPPTLAEAKERFAGVVCGGLRRWETVVLGTPEQVAAEAQAAIRATGGERFILGTGCVVFTNAPRANLMAARKSVE
jgi:uroporphyrinogen decarboxylase